MGQNVVCMAMRNYNAYGRLLWLLLFNGSIGGYNMTIAQRVEAILQRVPAARSSDKELLIIYMQKAGMELSDKQVAVFKELPSMETIRRVRQSLQEQGKYEASPEVTEARYQKYKNVKQNIGYDSTEKLLESQGKYIVPWNK